MTTLGMRGKWKTRNKTSTAREMSAVEAAWVGAMVEGEGHVSPRLHGKSSINFRVSNTSVEVISTLLRFTGVGRVYFQSLNPGRWRPVWLWTLTRMADVEAVGRQIRPFLGDKRAALDSLLEVIGE